MTLVLSNKKWLKNVLTYYDEETNSVDIVKEGSTDQNIIEDDRQHRSTCQPEEKTKPDYYWDWIMRINREWGNGRDKRGESKLQTPAGRT